jgi:hypothetical protein
MFIICINRGRLLGAPSFRLATLKELKDQFNVVTAHLFKAVRLGHFFKV